MRTSEEEPIGLIPCGGYARRLDPLPCSKELLPAGLRKAEDGGWRLKVVSHYLLERFQGGGIRKAFFIVRRGKWDIPEYYGDGGAFGMELGYLVADANNGPPYTLDKAYPFVRNRRVALGFPDMVFGPADAFGQALKRLQSTQADLVLGLFRVPNPKVSDMLRVDPDGRVRDLLIRPKRTKLNLGWNIAVWSPVFTEFLHEFLRASETTALRPSPSATGELTVGHVIRAAVHQGLRTQSVTFEHDTYLDIGTSDGLCQLSGRLDRKPLSESPLPKP